MSKIYAIIRLRGRVNRSYHIEHTMKLLRLHKPNHAVIYQVNGPLDGMLKKVRHAVTWGEVNSDTVEHLLRKRGRLSGKNKITDAHIKKNTEYNTIKQFAKAVTAGKANISDIPDIQPVFRLNPPRKGFKSLKYDINQSGDLGYRGESISSLINRMA